MVSKPILTIDVRPFRPPVIRPSLDHPQMSSPANFMLKISSPWREECVGEFALTSDMAKVVYISRGQPSPHVGFLG